MISDKGNIFMSENRFDKARYDMDFQKSHKTRMTLWFNNDKDSDILEWLNHIDTNKSEYIRDLIRQDISRNNKKKGR